MRTGRGRGRVQTSTERGPSGISPVSNVTEHQARAMKRQQDIEDLSLQTQPADSGISPVLRPLGTGAVTMADGILNGVLVKSPPNLLTEPTLERLRALVSAGDNIAYDFVLRVARTARVNAADMRHTTSYGSDALSELIRARQLDYDQHPILHIPPGTNDVGHNKRAKQLDGLSPEEAATISLGDLETKDSTLRAPLLPPSSAVAGAGRGTVRRPGGPPIQRVRPDNPQSGAVQVDLPNAGLIATQLIGSNGSGAGVVGSGGIAPPGGGVVGSGGIGPPAGPSQIVGSAVIGSLQSSAPGGITIVESVQEFEQDPDSGEEITTDELRRRMDEIRAREGEVAALAYWDAVAHKNPGASMFIESGNKQIPSSVARPPTIDPRVTTDANGNATGIAVATTAELLAAQRAQRGTNKSEPARTVLNNPATNIQIMGPNGTTHTAWNVGSLPVDLTRIALTPGMTPTNLEALRELAAGPRRFGATPSGRPASESSSALAAAADTLTDFMREQQTRDEPSRAQTMAELPPDIVLVFISHEMTQAIMWAYTEFRSDASAIQGASPAEFRARVPLIDLMAHRDVTADFADSVAFRLLYVRGLTGSGRQQAQTLDRIASQYRHSMSRLVRASYNSAGFLSYPETRYAADPMSISTINRNRAQFTNSANGAYTDMPSLMHGPATDQGALLPSALMTQSANLYGAAARITLSDTAEHPRSSPYPSREQIWQTQASAMLAARMLGSEF